MMRRPFPMLIAVAALASIAPATAQTFGPINADLPAGGDAVTKPLGADERAMFSASAWTLSAWVEPRAIVRGTALVGGFGISRGGGRRFLALIDGRPALVTASAMVASASTLTSERWTHVAATFDGATARLFVDGRQVAQRRLDADIIPLVARLAPRGDGPVFAGRIAAFTLKAGATDPAIIHSEAVSRPDPALIAFSPGSPTWPVQVKQMYGQTEPQDAWTLPRSKAPFSRPASKPVVAGPALEKTGDASWDIAGWRLAEAPRVVASGAQISRAGFDVSRWYLATVPGTVLTTLVDRGVYPDPAYGLNNMAIPEVLAHQDYWYRSEFDAPVITADDRRVLTFKGVNYAAEVWLNGVLLGTMKGAFVRGRFDVTEKLVSGRNVVALKVSPPPHPGIAQEESLTAGNGDNGGMMMLDGPTFVATEGWDWIPSIRDRNTGLWQGVTLSATGAAVIGDAQVVTTLPRADNSVANVEIDVPVSNPSDQPVTAMIRAAFDDVSVEKQIALQAGQTATVKMTPADFPQLSITNPKLWWPNGYGDPALHVLKLGVTVGARTSDTKRICFGMRQVTYDISLMDEHGNLRRVGIDLSRARQLGQRIVDGTHGGIRRSRAAGRRVSCQVRCDRRR